jgi:hypothetical protein
MTTLPQKPNLSRIFPRKKNLVRASLLACLLVALFAAGCGEGEPKAPEGLGDWPKKRLERFKRAERFANADLARDALLVSASRDLARVSAPRGPEKLERGLSKAWARYFPKVEVCCFKRRATPQRISAPVGFVRSGRGERSGPYIFSFAVRDTKKRCAGGYMSGFPRITEFRKVAMGRGRCSADQALKNVLAGG